MQRGVFTLSLDLELIWGTLDDHGPEAFRGACERERAEVIDRLLALLAEFEVPATWCVLGHLFLDACAPEDGVKHPEIVAPRRATGEAWFEHDPATSEREDPLFYGRSLIEKVRACPVPQEIGCHSFSHVLFGDRRCSRETAASELAECVRLADDAGIQLRSLAFPGNSVGHLELLPEFGFRCYRGPEPSWYAHVRSASIRRLAHLLDVLIARRPPVIEPAETIAGLWNVPASMMYFPMHGVRRNIPLSRRVKRAVKGLDRATKEGRVFHLWFHPTNLADEIEQMFLGLRLIFEHAAGLRRDGGLIFTPMGALPEKAS